MLFEKVREDFKKQLAAKGLLDSEIELLLDRINGKTNEETKYIALTQRYDPNGIWPDTKAFIEKFLQIEIPAEFTEKTNWTDNFLDEKYAEIRDTVIERDVDTNTFRRINKQLLAAEILKIHHFANLYPLNQLYWYNEQKGIWESNGEQVLANIITKIIAEYKTQTIRNEVISWIKDAVLENADNFDESFRGNLLNLENGVLDLETMRLLPHGPQYKFLWKLPIVWNPEMTNEETTKPLTELILSWTYPNPEKFISLLEYLAYPLVNYNMKKAILLLGEKDKGKSQFIHLYERFYGGENIAFKPLQILVQDTFALKALVGKLINTFADIPKKGLSHKEAGIFKALTGGDTIGVRVMHSQEELKINVAPKLIFSANFPPQIDDNADDDAYFSRWQLEFFENEIESDKKLSESELQEKFMRPEYIQAFFPILLAIGLHLREKGHFTYERDLTDIKKRYIAAGADVMLKFAEDMLERDGESMIDAQEVFAAVEKYCQEKGLTMPSMTAISTWLQDNYAVQISRPQEKGVRKRIYHGIKFKNPSQISQENPVENKELEDFLEKRDFYSAWRSYAQLPARLGPTFLHLLTNNLTTLLNYKEQLSPEKSVKVGHEADETDNLTSAAQKTTKLQILEDLPQMLWKSGSFGPFKQGETIEIDSEIADILLKSGKAEEVKD